MTPATSPRIVVLVPNLFFAARIGEVATRRGLQVASPPLAEAVRACRAAPTTRVILDLEQPGDVSGAIRALKADPGTSSIPIVAFYAHVHNALRESALAAGADLVLPRSAFSARLAELVAGEGGSAA